MRRARRLLYPLAATAAVVAAVIVAFAAMSLTEGEGQRERGRAQPFPPGVETPDPRVTPRFPDPALIPARPSEPTLIPASPQTGPSVVTVRGRPVELPSGIGLGSAIQECPIGVECLKIHILSRGDSWVSYTDKGIESVHVLPNDKADFDMILEQLSAVQWQE